MGESQSSEQPQDTVVGQPSGPGHAIMARLDLDAPLGRNVRIASHENEKPPHEKV